MSRAEYCAWPTARREASFMVMRCTAASELGPRNWISPMWLTSKRPTAVRTAMCSAMRPEYSTGMSHPPKSTILALRLRCMRFIAVCLSGAGVVTGVDMNGPLWNTGGKQGRETKSCTLLEDRTRGRRGQTARAQNRAIGAGRIDEVEMALCGGGRVTPLQQADYVGRFNHELTIGCRS